MNPGRGFVALPNEIMDLKMSSGAFRLLTLLCSYANHKTGDCHTPHEELASRMGKSKPSITAYLKELRALGLVASFSKRGLFGGNGYQRHNVTFWKEWRTALRKAGTERRQKKVDEQVADVQEAECGVQSSEREYNNHIHSNHTTAPQPLPQLVEMNEAPALRPDPCVSAVVEELRERWVELTRGASWSTHFNSMPSRDLVAKTEKLLADYAPVQADTAISDVDIERRLRSIWRSLGVRENGEALQEQVELVSQNPAPAAVLPALSAAIKRKWRVGFWRKMPEPHFFRNYLAEACAAAPATMASTLKVLRHHLKKYTELTAMKTATGDRQPTE
ncbi:helix-turn-helix domain-containing protein [Limimaricola cinnabarinus]|uniref:Helix-turn-helix domain-containing protein n=1 Tax=Limimaricola cinnabarinus LL-001 TaxID=1337093 RepID=U2YNP8_9RHOB|nr:helix-turn-helix domain-containing protein [Limimaricola cinnabarinus]GAD56936.1 hypothetical protein MBELCI_2988 [Limimaricola cinnabarinus LL-001]